MAMMAPPKAWSKSPPVDWQGTSNTVPYTMGEITMQVTMDVLNGKYPGGYLETPCHSDLYG